MDCHRFKKEIKHVIDDFKNIIEEKFVDYGAPSFEIYKLIKQAKFR